MITRFLHLAISLLLALSSGIPAVRAEQRQKRRNSLLWTRVLHPAHGRYQQAVGRAETLLSRGPRHRAEARRLLDAAIRLSPRRPEAYRALGQLHEDTRQWAHAARAYLAAMKRDPYYLPRNLRYRFAMASIRAGDFTAGAEALLKLVRPNVPSRMAAILITNAGEAYMAAGHLNKASELFRIAIARERTYAPPRYGLAITFHRKDQPKLAARFLQVALQQDPKLQALQGPHALFLPASDRHYYLALVWEQRRQRARARQAWRAFLAAAPRSPWRHQAHAALRRLTSAAGNSGRTATSGTRPGRPSGATRGGRILRRRR